MAEAEDERRSRGTCSLETILAVIFFRYVGVLCIYIYIYFSCRIKTQPAFFIDNRSCKNRVSRNILVDKRGGTPRSRANKIYLASSSRAESKGERDRFETRAQTTRVQQHSTVSFGMRFDATRAPTPPTDSPSACTLTLTLPTSLHREPLSLHRPLLHPPLAPRSSHHAAPWRSAFPSLALDSHTSPLLLCTARSLSFTHLSPPPSLRLPPSRSPILRLPSLFLSFRFPFDSVLGFLLPVSRFFLPSSFSFLLSQFALRRQASSITRFLSHRLDLSDSRSSLGKGRFVLRPSMLAPTGEIFCIRICGQLTLIASQLNHRPRTRREKFVRSVVSRIETREGELLLSVPCPYCAVAFVRSP